MRELGGYIGAEVGWDSSNQVAIIEKYTDDSKKETTRIEVPIGYTKGVITKDYSNQTETQNLANIDDDNPVLPSLLINGSTYLPLRYISENMGYEVTYFSDGNEIHLTNDGNPAPTQSYKSVAEAQAEVSTQTQASQSALSTISRPTTVVYEGVPDSGTHGLAGTIIGGSTLTEYIGYNTYNPSLLHYVEIAPYYGDPKDFNFPVLSSEIKSNPTQATTGADRPTAIVDGVMTDQGPNYMGYNTNAVAFKATNGETYMKTEEGTTAYQEVYDRYHSSLSAGYLGGVRDYTAEYFLVQRNSRHGMDLKDIATITEVKDLLDNATADTNYMDFGEAVDSLVNIAYGDDIFWNHVYSELYAGEEQPTYQGTYEYQLSIEKRLVLEFIK